MLRYETCKLSPKHPCTWCNNDDKAVMALTIVVVNKDVQICEDCLHNGLTLIEKEILKNEKSN